MNKIKNTIIFATVMIFAISCGFKKEFNNRKRRHSQEIYFNNKKIKKNSEYSQSGNYPKRTYKFGQHRNKGTRDPNINLFKALIQKIFRWDKYNKKSQIKREQYIVLAILTALVPISVLYTLKNQILKPIKFRLLVNKLKTKLKKITNKQKILSEALKLQLNTIPDAEFRGKSRPVIQKLNELLSAIADDKKIIESLTGPVKESDEQKIDNGKILKNSNMIKYYLPISSLDKNIEFSIIKTPTPSFDESFGLFDQITEQVLIITKWEKNLEKIILQAKNNRDRITKCMNNFVNQYKILCLMITHLKNAIIRKNKEIYHKNISNEGNKKKQKTISQNRVEVIIKNINNKIPTKKLYATMNASIEEIMKKYVKLVNTGNKNSVINADHCRFSTNDIKTKHTHQMEEGRYISNFINCIDKITNILEITCASR